MQQPMNELLMKFLRSPGREPLNLKKERWIGLNTSSTTWQSQTARSQERSTSVITCSFSGRHTSSWSDKKMNSPRLALRQFSKLEISPCPGLDINFILGSQYHSIIDQVLSTEPSSETTNSSFAPNCGKM